MNQLTTDQLLNEKDQKIAQLEQALALEAALERVRNRIMWMQRSHELREVVSVMYDEMELLGLAKWGCNIMICHQDKEVFEFWLAEETDANQTRNYFVKGKEHPIYRKIWTNWEKQTNPFTLHHLDEYKLAFDKYWIEETDFKHLPDEVKANVYNRNEVFLNYAPMKHGLLNAISYEKISDELLTILARFAKVFEQTYTRFLDLQKAEVQAREAQIEAALEKIRNRTLLMKDSSELNEAVATFFQQFKSLDLLPGEARAFFAHINEAELVIQAWMTRMDGTVMSGSHFTPLDAPSLLNFYDAWKRKSPILIRNYEGEALKNYLNFVASLPHVKKDKDYQQLFQSNPERIVMTDAFFLQGSINMMTFEPLSQEAQDMLVRFAKVFEFTYTRFLDLQKAEVQAREAQIEAALERVRAKAMAMHKSEELAEVVDVVFKQLQVLNFGNYNTHIGIIDEEKGIIKYWNRGMDEFNFPFEFEIPIKGHAYTENWKEEWKRGMDFSTLLVKKGKILDDWNEHLFSLPALKDRMPKDAKQNILALEEVWFSQAFMQHGMLHAHGPLPLSEEKIAILKRFTKVLDLTYTRMLDLQTAEAQAKEAQIEAALERVRAASMSMHKSTEISQVAATMMTQFNELGIPKLRRCVMYTIDQEREQIQCWYSTESGSTFSNNFSMPIRGDKIVEQIFYAWRDRQLVAIEVAGKAYEKYVQFMKKHGWQYPKGEKSAKRIVLNEFPFDNGLVEITAYDMLPEKDQEIGWRFAKVFEQTYTRFLDLQKAEKQAQEIEKVFNENQRLLHSILPEQIAEQIRQGQQTVVKRFEQVSILFADIVGFTILSEKLSPQKVVDILNGLFSKFDDLTDKYQLEKIKTIGDAYMVASGVPEEKENHALVLFQFAQEMLQAIQIFNQVHNLTLEIRIGISSGPVVAGVIGKKKFAYDLWGDTVNTAARMEAYGQASCIQLAPPSYKLLKNDFVFEKIPQVAIKGKGKMDVYVWTA